jgi:hypothetical protein
VERLGREGGNFFYKFIMGLGKGCIGERVHVDFFSSFFFTVEGEGVGG